MITILITIALIVIPIKYVLLSFTMERPKNLDDYHFGSHQIRPRDFIDTSVAYGLQVAALTLFATWGYQYGFWVIWVPIFWMLGYILLGSLIARGHLDSVIFGRRSDTIHGFIGERLGGSLTYLASAISLLAIIGTAMYEADFAASFSSEIILKSTEQAVDPQGLHNLKTMLFAAFVVAAGSYMVLCGYKAIVFTDTIQLLLGLVSFTCVVGLLAFMTAGAGHQNTALQVLLICIVLLAALILYWHKQKIPGSFEVASFRFSPALLALAIILICALVGVLVVGDNSADTTNNSPLQLGAPFGLGGLLLFNLFIANFSYQLVDVGQYQRLISVSTTDDDENNTRAVLRRSTFTIGLYSGFSWVIAIAFGILLKSYFAGEEIDAYSIVMAFGSSMLGSGLVGHTILILLLVSILCLMFSSLDSYIAGISFTADSDLARKLAPKAQLIRPRLVSSIILAGGFVATSYLFPYLKDKHGIGYAAEFLYLCWALQIALLPLIVGAFFRIKIPALAYWICVLVGVFAAAAPFVKDVYAVYQTSAWAAALASMAALGVSVIIQGVWNYFIKSHDK